MTRVCHTRLILALALLAVCSGGFSLRAEQGRRPTTAQIRAEAEAAAYFGENIVDEQYMMNNGVSSADRDAIKKSVEQLLKEAKEAGRGLYEEHNMNEGGEFEWNLGQVYYGYKYTLRFPLMNNCRIPQVATMVYPTAFDLKGPATVTVPAKSIVDVELVLTIPRFDIPEGPLPLGMNLQCIPALDKLIIKTSDAGAYVPTPFGEYWYRCWGRSPTYHVSLHRHFHPDPPPPDGGGGPERKPNTCDIYWNTGEFTPDREHIRPEQCREDLVQLAFDMLTQEIAPLQKLHDSSAFSWLPAGVDPSGPPDVLRRALTLMSVEQLVALRRAAEQFVLSLRGPSIDEIRAIGTPPSASPAASDPMTARPALPAPSSPKPADIRRP